MAVQMESRQKCTLCGTPLAFGDAGFLRVPDGRVYGPCCLKKLDPAFVRSSVRGAGIVTGPAPFSDPTDAQEAFLKAFVAQGGNIDPILFVGRAGVGTVYVTVSGAVPLAHRRPILSSAVEVMQPHWAVFAADCKMRLELTQDGSVVVDDCSVMSQKDRRNARECVQFQVETWSPRLGVERIIRLMYYRRDAQRGIVWDPSQEGSGGVVGQDVDDVRGMYSRWLPDDYQPTA